MALSSGADQNQTTSRILNKLHYALTHDAADGSALAVGDVMLVLDASDNYEPKYATLSGLTATSASTSGSSSVEPLSLATTMTGAGGVGGRAKFKMSTEVVLGGWANALKAEVDFGDTGAVTGLGSAFVAEMTLGLSMAAGNYAPLEIELNAPSGADTGTATSLIYASVNGADSSTVDTSGYLLNLAGVATAAEDKMWAAHTLSNVNEVTHGLRIKTPDGDFYLLAATAANFT